MGKAAIARKILQRYHREAIKTYGRYHFVTTEMINAARQIGATVINEPDENTFARIALPGELEGEMMIHILNSDNGLRVEISVPESTSQNYMNTKLGELTGETELMLSMRESARREPKLRRVRI